MDQIISSLTQQSEQKTPSAAVPTSVLIVDGTNLDRSCLQVFQRNDIDFGKLFDAITAGTNLLKTYYFTAPYDQRIDRKAYAQQSGAINQLRSMGVEVRLGRHQRETQDCRNCGHQFDRLREKGTDVGAASHLVRAACRKTADRLFLVTGDNDFFPALEVAKDEGAHCIVAFVMSESNLGKKPWFAIANLRDASKGNIIMGHKFMASCWRDASVSAK